MILMTQSFEHYTAYNLIKGSVSHLQLIKLAWNKNQSKIIWGARIARKQAKKEILQEKTNV